VIRERFPEYMPAERIIVRDRQTFGAQVKKAAATVTAGSEGGEGVEGGGGCDIVMDAVMGDYFKGGWDNLGRGGRYVVFGAADLTPSGDLVGLYKSTHP
jgi:NADPH:quinone reductase-like Zn-dependent oxidoreductase